MDKFSLSKAVGFFFYMLLEHELGKREVGSVIGLLKGLFVAVFQYIISKIRLFLKRGKL